MEPSKIHFSRKLLQGAVAKYLAAITSGFLLFASFPLIRWSFLAWVALLPLLGALLFETQLLRGFLLGYASGGVFFAGNCYWIVAVMERYGGLSIAISLGILVLFVGLFSVFFGAFGLIEVFVARRSRLAGLCLSPFLWVSTELARTYLFTGFPWDLLGYAVRSVGLEQLASVTGVYGLSFLAAASSAITLWMLTLHRRKVGVIALLVWILALSAADHFLDPPPLDPGKSAAILVQPNIPLGGAAVDAWAPWNNPQPLEQLVSSSLRAARDAHASAPPLMVWPEDSAPFYFDRDPVFHAALENLAEQARAYLIAGTVTFKDGKLSMPRNSAVVLSPDGDLLLRYDKMHLVPFGEYVPWWAFPGKTGKITSQVGDFVPGSRVRVAKTPEGRIGVFICYEAIFPQLVRNFVRAGAQVLVNISDDGWYGNSSAGFEHFWMARFRAIENHRFLLRATNDGITAIVDPYGRVEKKISRGQFGILEGHFRYLKGETFYTQYGDVFAWLAFAVTVMIVGWAAKDLAAGRKSASGQTH
jgi:apolipoprotein N-acyltransferase